MSVLRSMGNMLFGPMGFVFFASVPQVATGKKLARRHIASMVSSSYNTCVLGAILKQTAQLNQSGENQFGPKSVLIPDSRNANNRFCKQFVRKTKTNKYKTIIKIKTADRRLEHCTAFCFYLGNGNREHLSKEELEKEKKKSCQSERTLASLQSTGSKQSQHGKRQQKPTKLQQAKCLLHRICEYPFCAANDLICWLHVNDR